MPEITSVERIREKLREFDERVDGAVVAAKTLVRIKTDAEKFLAQIQNVSNRSEQSLQEAESVRSQLQLLLSELDSAVQSIGQKLTEAEERLRDTNKASLAEQADQLRRLDDSTRANAEAAANAQALAVERAERLNQLLGTTRDELESQVFAKLDQAEKLLDERINAFKEEIKRSLSDHEQSIDRQITDFLNKQNALIENLTQQIDSYNRVSQALSADLASTNSRLTELQSHFDAHGAATRSELAGLVKEMGDLKDLLAEAKTSLTAQGKSLRDTTARLTQTTEKLKDIPLLGRKFRDR